MQTSDFNYHLPPEFIAQKPAEPRDSSRLMVLDRQTGAIQHKVFRDMLDFLKPNDLLVFNDTKVFKARLIGKLGANKVEVFLIHPLDGMAWLTLAKPGKKIKIGQRVEFLMSDDPGSSLSAKLVAKNEDGTFVFDFGRDPAQVIEIANRIGHIPVPPYIKTEPQSEKQYQTVYAKHIGSVAAPTAGFHFTPELIKKIQARGTKTAYVTLHVGLGTFLPIKTTKLEEHKMHSEWAKIPAVTIHAIEDTKKHGGRIIAVGTTTVRTLEGLLGSVTPGLDSKEGWINLFIKPGYNFNIIDGLITNFHLPKSSLLVLVSAFAGREKILRAYQEAVANKYRFYSFGDAMLII